MRKYKMVFSDIDGTLLDSTHQVRDNTKRKIKELEKREYLLFLYQQECQMEYILYKKL